MNRRHFLSSLAAACTAAIAARSWRPLARALRPRVLYVGNPADLPSADAFYPATNAGLRSAMCEARRGDTIVLEPNITYRIDGTPTLADRLMARDFYFGYRDPDLSPVSYDIVAIAPRVL